MTARYVFFTHGSFLNYYSKRQKVINIWHGVGHKKIGTYVGNGGIYANVTVATSELTKYFFAKAFDVPEESVLICGYPRNDVLIRSKEEKSYLKSKIGDGLALYDKIIIWLPTYRKSVRGDIRQDGVEVNNPFYIKNFNVSQFNKILQEHNTCCLVKPHPMAPKFEGLDSVDNLIFIDDEWIANKKMTLYQLLGCTDILVSDISSVMIDYLLLDQPVVCISEDFAQYKETRGFYFDDIENWIPSQVNETQQDYFEFLELLLSTERDPFEAKRIGLKNSFFSFHDALSTQRLTKYVFED